MTREDFAATGAAAADTEDVVNMTLVISGTEVAVISVEQPDGSVKVSFRSRAGLDAAGWPRALVGAVIKPRRAQWFPARWLWPSRACLTRCAQRCDNSVY